MKLVQAMAVICIVALSGCTDSGTKIGAEQEVNPHSPSQAPAAMNPTRADSKAIDQSAQAEPAEAAGEEASEGQSQEPAGSEPQPEPEPEQEERETPEEDSNAGAPVASAQPESPPQEPAITERSFTAKLLADPTSQATHFSMPVPSTGTRWTYDITVDAPEPADMEQFGTFAASNGELVGREMRYMYWFGDHRATWPTSVHLEEMQLIVMLADGDSSSHVALVIGARSSSAQEISVTLTATPATEAEYASIPDEFVLEPLGSAPGYRFELASYTSQSSMPGIPGHWATTGGFQVGQFEPLGGAVTPQRLAAKLAGAGPGYQELAGSFASPAAIGTWQLNLGSGPLEGTIEHSISGKASSLFWSSAGDATSTGFHEAEIDVTRAGGASFGAMSLAIPFTMEELTGVAHPLGVTVISGLLD